jgi:GNAT superfamily N-acetyltransferase
MQRRAPAMVTIDPPDSLGVYASVPSAFEVRTVLDLSAGDLNATDPAAWVEQIVAPPYVKDYDAVPGNHPTDWRELLRGARSVQLGAHVGHQRLGGAVLLHDGPEVDLLEGRRDLALLWDIRVAASHRGRGIGGALFAAATAWAHARGCRELLVETQDINAPACRFYARQGCRLDAVRPRAYVQFPEETQLLWRLAPISSA